MTAAAIGAAAAGTTTAWIAAAAAIIAAAISGGVALRQASRSSALQTDLASKNSRLQTELANENSRLQTELTRQNGELQSELSRLNSKLEADLARLNGELEFEVAARKAVMQRDMQAEDVLKRYCEPLAAAAFDLQSRLYNILRKDFFAQFGGDHERCMMAEKTTLFRIAQYFGWTEILRRNIQFLSFPTADETRKVIELQWMISRRFGTSEDHQGMMVWTDEQRAIGERMIIKEHDVVLCMGYARFEEEYPAHFEQWCEHLRAPLQAAEARPRLIELQRMLCELVRRLDPDGMRYNSDLDSA